MKKRKRSSRVWRITYRKTFDSRITKEQVEQWWEKFGPDGELQTVELDLPFTIANPEDSIL